MLLRLISSFYSWWQRVFCCKMRNQRFIYMTSIFNYEYYFVIHLFIYTVFPLIHVLLLWLLEVWNKVLNAKLHRRWSLEDICLSRTKNIPYIEHTKWKHLLIFNIEKAKGRKLNVNMLYHTTTSLAISCVLRFQIVMITWILFFLSILLPVIFFVFTCNAEKHSKHSRQ